MEILEAIHSRGSVKAFKPDPVERELIEQLLDAAIRAPNHKLTAPWGFFVLTGVSKTRFAELRRAQRAQSFADPEAPEAQKALQKAFDVADGTPAIIAVTSHVADDPVRLGTYLRTGALLDDRRVADLLGVPDGHRVVGTIHLGYPAEEPKLRARTPAAEKTHWLG